MTAYGGRLEAQITATSISQDFVNAAGTTTVTLNGDYSGPTELIASIASQLGGGWSVTWSSGEGPPSSVTGQVTIDSATHHPFHVTWSGSVLRDILGFTGNIAATSSPATGTAHVLGAWLPGVVKFTKAGDQDRGVPVNDFRQNVSPTGTVYSLIGNTYDVIDDIAWSAVPGQRARAHLESVTGESFETFLRNCQFASYLSSVFSAGAPVRFFWNADSTAHYVDGTLLHGANWNPDPMVRGWTGRFAINLPRLVVSDFV